MGWAKDWLYGLIFAEVRRLWDTAVKEGEGRFGPPPEYLGVSQFEDVQVTPYQMVLHDETPSRFRIATFRGPLVRTWRFDATGPQFQAAPPVPTRQPVAIRGMFHEIGRVSFAISTDRKLVAFTYVLGPRAGRCWTFAVRGQGKRASLKQHPDFVIRVA